MKITITKRQEEDESTPQRLARIESEQFDRSTEELKALLDELNKLKL